MDIIDKLAQIIPLSDAIEILSRVIDEHKEAKLIGSDMLEVEHRVVSTCKLVNLCYMYKSLTPEEIEKLNYASGIAQSLFQDKE